MQRNSTINRAQSIIKKKHFFQDLILNSRLKESYGTGDENGLYTSTISTNYTSKKNSSEKRNWISPYQIEKNDLSVNSNRKGDKTTWPESSFLTPEKNQKRDNYKSEFMSDIKGYQINQQGDQLGEEQEEYENERFEDEEKEIYQRNTEKGDEDNYNEEYDRENYEIQNDEGEERDYENYENDGNFEQQQKKQQQQEQNKQVNQENMQIEYESEDEEGEELQESDFDLIYCNINEYRLPQNSVFGRIRQKIKGFKYYSPRGIGYAKKRALSEDRCQHNNSYQFVKDCPSKLNSANIYLKRGYPTKQLEISPQKVPLNITKKFEEDSLNMLEQLKSNSCHSSANHSKERKNSPSFQWDSPVNLKFTNKMSLPKQISELNNQPEFNYRKCNCSDVNHDSSRNLYKAIGKCESKFYQNSFVRIQKL